MGVQRLRVPLWNIPRGQSWRGGIGKGHLAARGTSDGLFECLGPREAVWGSPNHSYSQIIWNGREREGKREIKIGKREEEPEMSVASCSPLCPSCPGVS